MGLVGLTRPEKDLMRQGLTNEISPDGLAFELNFHTTMDGGTLDRPHATRSEKSSIPGHQYGNANGSPTIE